MVGRLTKETVPLALSAKEAQVWPFSAPIWPNKISRKVAKFSHLTLAASAAAAAAAQKFRGFKSPPADCAAIVSHRWKMKKEKNFFHS